MPDSDGTAAREDAMNEPKAAQPKPTAARWLATHLRMRKPSWAYDTPRNGIRRRLYCLLIDNHPWWDWGHKLMILVGQDFGGNWSEPEPSTWWYHRGHGKPHWRTHYPRSTFEVITDYDEFRRRTDGLNEDGMYEWKAINVNQDGALHLGHQYWGGTFYDMPSDEMQLLRRYLRRWHRMDWLGLRTWLWHQALHAAVYRHKPFSCGVRPPKGHGGYDHWLCTLPKRHEGMHRFNNYVWGDVGGEPIGTFYEPMESVR